MMIQPEPLTRQTFAAFGDVIEISGAKQFAINDGYTTRVHDLFQPELLGSNARILINYFLGRPRPLDVAMVERHPYGSQAFIPIDKFDWWVVVAAAPRPDALRCFRAGGDQGVNYHAGTWHHPLLVDRAQQFLVIDRHGAEHNLEEAFFEHPRRIDRSPFAETGAPAAGSISGNGGGPRVS